MALRIQRERMSRACCRRFVNMRPATGSRASGWRSRGPGARHPGPMNEGVEIAPDVAAGAQSVVEEQVRNGVAVRMALLYLLAGARG